MKRGWLSARALVALLTAEVFAGVTTAMLFYAEYLGLGSQWSMMLLDFDGGASGMGHALAFVGVVLACLCALLVPGAWVTGPRAASVVVLTAGLAEMATQRALDAHTRSAAVGIAVAAAAATLLIGCFPRALRWLGRLPPALLHSFNYATAVFIVSEAVSRSLVGCVGIDRVASWLIFCASVALGALWKPASRALAHSAGRSWISRLGPLGIVVALAAAWGVYELSPLAGAGSAECGRLGLQELRLDLLLQRPAQVWEVVSDGLSADIWLRAVFYGMVAGFIVLLETCTALASVEGACGPEQPHQLGHMRVLVLTNAASAAAGCGVQSVSAARTHTIRLLGGSTRLSVLVHGLALIALIAHAGPMLAAMPQLVVGVVLTIVGIQMITPEMAGMWRDAYDPRASGADLHAATVFWLVLLASLATGSVVGGFVAGAIVWWVPRAWRQLRAGAWQYNG
jgi:MFS superfamily sulfate permease-like transporter